MKRKPKKQKPHRGVGHGLTEEEVAQMYRFYQAGIPLERIGLAFGRRTAAGVQHMFRTRGWGVRARGEQMRKEKNEREAADAFFEMGGAAEQLTNTAAGAAPQS